MSTPQNITSAIKTLNPLLEAIEGAFWDTCEIQVKDRLFDLMTCIHAEMNELAKLSVSDLDMTYETITPEFSSCCAKLRYISQNVDAFFPRTKTAEGLKQALPAAADMITECRL